MLGEALRGSQERHAVNGPARQRRRRAAVPVAPLGPILAQAEEALGPVAGLSIHHPGRRDALVRCSRCSAIASS